MALKKKGEEVTAAQAVETIGKLQFKVLNEVKTVSEKMLQLPEVFGKIQEKVAEIEKAFAYNVQEKEVELTEKMKALDQTVNDHAATIDQKKRELEIQLDARKQDYTRQVEQLQYQHQIAVRDQSLKIAETIANQYDKQLIDKQMWLDKQAIERFNVDKLKEIEQLRVKEVEGIVNARRDIDLNTIRQSYEMKLALADRDIASLTKEVETLRKEQMELKKTIDMQNQNIVKVAEAATRPTTVFENKK